MSPNGIKQLKILIVEDDLIDRKQLERLLSKSDLSTSEVKHTEYLENALELMDQDDFDIALLDLNLPDSNGIDTLIKVSEKHPRTATVIITGLGGVGLGLKAVAKGAQDYLVKGEFDIQMLSKSIYYAIERKKAELAMRESEAQYRLLFKSANEAIFIVKGEQFIDCNPSTLRIFGCTKEQIEGQPLFQFSPELQPDGRDSIEKAQEKINLALEKKPQFFDWRCKRYDGMPFDAEVSLNPLALSGGVLLQAMVRDITERKRAAEALRLAYEKLEKANRELKEMQSQMVQSEKLASIGQLAAGVAHEMNTPVGFVASNFQTLQSYMNKFRDLLTMYDELASEVESSKKEILLNKISVIDKSRNAMKIDFILKDIQGLFDDSREGIERVTNIIQNLRDFSRIDQAEFFDAYNINEGVEATLVVAKNEIKYDADVKTELSKVPAIYCNSGQINQVFLNIIMNAAQAIKSQQRGENEKGTIAIKTYSTADKVICEIEDDGPGIDSDKLTKVFDPFFTTKPVGKGTGLGLSVSYDIIVSKHKGKLLVDSTVGKGSKFTIKLPISKKKVDDKKEEVAVAITSEGK